MSFTLDKRNAGCGAIFEDKLYVWGGETVDIRRPYEELLNNSDSSSDESSSEEEEDEEGEESGVDPNLVIETVVTLPRPNDKDHPFDVLDLRTRKWSRQPTTGSVPTVGNGSSLNAHLPSRSLLLYGGWNDGQFNAKIYKISVDSWEWELVQICGDVKPSPRYLTGVLMHRGRMCMFGGVGKDIVAEQDPGATYVPYIDSGVERDFGINNEYYEFDTSENEWTAPLEKSGRATRPPPTGAFAFAKFDDHRALMFGGNKVMWRRVNDVYVFDLDDRIWSQALLQASSPNQQWPLPNRFGTLTPLIDPDMVGQSLCGSGPVLKQRLVLLWGKDTQYHISPETWLLDVDSLPNLTWTPLAIPAKPRSWHTACPHYSQTSDGCDIVVFGGNMHIKGNEGDRDNTADLNILSFGVNTLVTSCLSVIVETDALMAQLSTLPPLFQTLITNAREARLNCPRITSITTVSR